MKRSTTNKYLYYFIGVVLLIVIWTIISLLFDETNMIFPNIFKVFKETINILKDSYVYKCLFNTLTRMLIGFGISIVLAIVLATLASTYEKLKYIFAPFMTVLKTIPTATLVFFFLVLSGAKNAPIYIVILICLPILYESILGGYENIDESINDDLALLNNSVLLKIVYVRFPLCKDYLLVGIASSLGLSFKIEIMAEVLTGLTTNGLGSAIAYIQKVNPTNMTGIFAYSLIAIFLAILIDLVCYKFSNNKIKL